MNAFDPDMLDRQTGGDAALKREVLGLFLAQAEAVQAEVGADGTRAETMASLHRLQGSARAVGALRLDAAAGRLETALRSTEPPPPDVIADLQDAIADACRYAAALPTGGDASISPNGLKADNHLRPSRSRSDRRALREPES